MIKLKLKTCRPGCHFKICSHNSNSEIILTVQNLIQESSDLLKEPALQPTQ